MVQEGVAFMQQQNPQAAAAAAAAATAASLNLHQQQQVCYVVWQVYIGEILLPGIKIDEYLKDPKTFDTRVIVSKID